MQTKRLLLGILAKKFISLYYLAFQEQLNKAGSYQLSKIRND